jgi:hypothetical protein
MTDGRDGADPAVSAPSRPITGRRAEFERRQRRRSTFVAAISTVLVAAAIILIVPLAPGWDDVRSSFFDPDEFRNALPKLVEPFLLNLRLFQNRVFAVGNLATFILGAGFLGAIVFLPLFMVNVVGLSATSAGLTLTPLTFGTLKAAIYSMIFAVPLAVLEGLMRG